ncbi:uncharacterized protein N7503_005644 [Penicillium pulvis]|uniref:uncharacterized protein n=1 Tax=Penicillium pulvis TaxID=1562058 RepID=UPI0025489810|nr:uncharacterized protein N7503_005644 [Penicillium pulvis]KAJ5803194.1 hypothetical protein N7503_005644 [Penicillium pulvis]
MPPDSKTKIRPQQSCLRCRERKVKCDRSIPCHACIIRGIESECTYLTTPEDREHIGQAEVIDRLRREVAELRTQLSQGPRPRPHPKALSERGKSRDRAPYARPSKSGKGSGSGSRSGSGSDGVGGGYAGGAGAGGAGAVADMREGSWDGSSPSSSMTRSMSINSPGSTGSGTASHAQVYPGSTFGTNIAEDMTTTSAAFIGANFMDETLAHCQGGISAFAPGEIPASIPMQNLQPQASGIHVMPASQMYQGGNAVENWGNAPYMQDYAPAPAPHTSSSGIYEPQLYQHNPQWGQAHQFAPVPPYLDSYSSSSIGVFAANTDSLNVHSSQQPSHSPSSQQFSSPESLSQHPLFAMPSSWTGKGKQELLETLLETIGSCDEAQVAQVVQVVRTSATPEEAVSGICRVLGIGRGR